MKTVVLVVLILWATVEALRIAFLLRARLRIRRQPHATWIGPARQPPWLAGLALGVLVMMLLRPDLRSADHELLGWLLWILVGTASLLTWRHGTWIHDEGVELPYGHFSWSALRGCGVVSVPASGAKGPGWALEVEPSLQGAKPLHVPLSPAQAETARVALARVGRAKGLPTDG
jgi:hypothetical protein